MYSGFSLQSVIQDNIEESQRVHALIDTLIPQVEKAAEACIEALGQGKKIVFFGNGGSAADAQHLAAEFTGRFLTEREPLPALALTTNSSALTAIGNDYAYASVFERQVKALVHDGDIVVGISTSGNSENVLRGLHAAKKKGAVTIGLSGNSGTLAKSVDIALAVPSSSTPRIQEGHILLGHALTHAVEVAMVAKTKEAVSDTVS